MRASLNARVDKLNHSLASLAPSDVSAMQEINQQIEDLLMNRQHDLAELQMLEQNVLSEFGKPPSETK